MWPITAACGAALTLTFAQRVRARRVSFARPSLERAGPPQSAAVGGLIFCLAAEATERKTADSCGEQKG